MLRQEIMVVRTTCTPCCGTSPEFEIGRKSICFNRDWPNEMFLMASRNWSNVDINGSNFDTQSSFFSGPHITDFDHQLVAYYLASLDVTEFKDWLSKVGTKFARDEITVDWLAEQSVNHDLNGRFGIKMAGITTFPASPTGEQGTRSLHLAFLLDKNIQNVRNSTPTAFRPPSVSQ